MEAGVRTYSTAARIGPQTAKHNETHKTHIYLRGCHRSHQLAPRLQQEVQLTPESRSTCFPFPCQTTPNSLRLVCLREVLEGTLPWNSSGHNGGCGRGIWSTRKPSRALTAGPGNVCPSSGRSCTAPASSVSQDLPSSQSPCRYLPSLLCTLGLMHQKQSKSRGVALHLCWAPSRSLKHLP